MIFIEILNKIMPGMFFEIENYPKPCIYEKSTLAT